ncbi:MAG: DNA ligase-associated DEXH box helicase, partial [Acidobacteriota bacterium]
MDDDGLRVNGGGFHVDPWRPVPLAVVTHAHADHARPGSGRYLASAASKPVLQHRLGPEAVIDTLEPGEVRRFGDVDVSLHPAGHVLGSSQVRLCSPARGETWVVSGDYKRDPDPTCDPFEVVPCDVFIPEATFALPIYRWPSAEAEIEG